MRLAYHEIAHAKTVGTCMVNDCKDAELHSRTLTGNWRNPFRFTVLIDLQRSLAVSTHVIDATPSADRAYAHNF